MKLRETQHQIIYTLRHSRYQSRHRCGLWGHRLVKEGEVLRGETLEGLSKLRNEGGRQRKRCSRPLAAVPHGGLCDETQDGW